MPGTGSVSYAMDCSREANKIGYEVVMITFTFSNLGVKTVFITPITPMGKDP
jgi:hypothetical protein